MTARNAGINIVDFAIGHQLGFFKRTLYRLHGRLNIDHHAFFQAAVGGGGHKIPIKIGTFQKRALYFAFILLNAFLSITDTPMLLKPYGSSAPKEYKPPPDAFPLLSTSGPIWT